MKIFSIIFSLFLLVSCSDSSSLSSNIEPGSTEPGNSEPSKLVQQQAILPAAQWMVASDSTAMNQWLAYRKTFDVSTIPTKAIADIAVDSKYWLWLNGELIVREGQLKRGPTRNSTYMDKVDLAPYLKQGSNTVAILQWYFGKPGFSHNSSGSAGLYFNLISPELQLVSDQGWRVQDVVAYGAVEKWPSEIKTPNFRLNESSVLFDARKEIKGWMDPDFDDANWSKPMLKGPRGSAPWGELEERPIPQWKDWSVKEYVKITTEKLGNGATRYTAHTPYNAQLHPILEVKAAAGKNIAIDTDGTFVHRGGLRGGYITRQGYQQYEHLPWLSGQRVFYTVPAGVEVISLKYRETGYDAEKVGSWQSDDPVLDELWKRAYRTLYVNMRDTYFDCPDRERAQWWGDLVVQFGQNLYVMDYENGQALEKKAIYELARWQRPEDNGLYSPIPSAWPEAGLDHTGKNDGYWVKELPYQMLASVGQYGFQRYYEFTGDSDTINVVYPYVKRYLAEFNLNQAGVTVNRRSKGAWVWVDWGKNFDEAVLASAWHALALKGAIRMAEVSGNQADINSYQAKLSSLQDNFHKTYWQGTHYQDPKRQGEVDDRANAMAVVSGLAPKSTYPAIRKVLNREMHASPYMEKYVEEAQFVMGYADDALTRMKSRYQVMLDLPLTTLREQFSATHGTDNHAWSGGPLTLMQEFIAGIYPLQPAYDHFQIKPVKTTVKKLSTTVATPKGKLSLNLNYGENAFRLDLKIPAGAKGRIHIPNAKKGSEQAVSEIYLNGKLVWKDGAGIAQSTALSATVWSGHVDGYEVFENVGNVANFVALY